MSTYSAPHTVLGTRDIAVNKTKPLPFWKSDFRGEGIQKADKVIYCFKWEWRLTSLICVTSGTVSSPIKRSNNCIYNISQTLIIWSLYFYGKMKYTLNTMLFWGWLLGLFGSLLSAQPWKWLSRLLTAQGKSISQSAFQGHPEVQFLPSFVPFKVNSILL